MRLKIYNTFTLENVIFNLFLAKLRKFCYTREEKLTFDQILNEFKLIKMRRNRSNIKEITAMVSSSLFSKDMGLITNLWKESIEEAKKRMYVPKTIKKGITCAICLDNEVDTYITHDNIMHGCICSECTFDLMIHSCKSKCPLCRKTIENVISLVDTEEEDVRLINRDENGMTVNIGKGIFTKYNFR